MLFDFNRGVEEMYQNRTGSSGGSKKSSAKGKVSSSARTKIKKENIDLGFLVSVLLLVVLGLIMVFSASYPTA